jgi:hypothetical protein
MFVAMFTWESGMVGRLITYHQGRFVLENEGAIEAARVLAFDRLDLIEWVHPGLRSWVADQVGDASVRVHLTKGEGWTPFQDPD